MKPLIILLFALVFISCNTSKNKDYANADIINTEIVQEHPGKKLMETYCYACHSATASEETRLAPPMIAIKKRYITKNTSKDDFIKAMQEWIKNPTEEKAKMYGAVRRFGVMAKTPYPEETIMQIADYMFDHSIEQPEWFEAHFKNKRKSNE